MNRLAKYNVKDPTALSEADVQRIIASVQPINVPSAARRVYNLGAYVLKVDYDGSGVRNHGGNQVEVQRWNRANHDLRRWLCPILAYHLTGESTGSWVVMPRCRSAYPPGQDPWGLAVYQKYRRDLELLRHVLDLAGITDQHLQNVMTLREPDGKRRLVSVDYAGGPS